eukprot:XP_001705464.1 Hypothetical protein GL50803_34780 [Giardia lamblia ATCC 50803]
MLRLSQATINANLPPRVSRKCEVARLIQRLYGHGL